MSTDPHATQPVLTDGELLTSAAAVVILLHGRGAVAQDALRFARHFPRARVCYLAPQAAGNQWYPQRFLASLESNEPMLSSALAVVMRLVERATSAGVARECVLIGGFSQGACLALEAAARTGGRFGGVFAMAGALIGPAGGVRSFDRPLEGTPVFLGCGDADAHIPLASVEESARVLTGLGAAVDMQIYRGVGHVVIGDQLTRSGEMVERVLA